MATIAENLQKIVDIKQDIKTAIENKGVTVGDSSFTDYPTLINNIPQENTGGDITLTNIDITINGTYTAPDGEGYKTINVDVPTGGGTGSGLDFSLIKYNSDLTKQINDVYNADIAYSKQLLDEWDNETTTANNLYSENILLKYAPNINTSNVTDMSNMFYNCSSLEFAPTFNTSNVLYMTNMFAGCANLKIFSFTDTSNVVEMSSMFTGCKLLTTIPAFNTYNVTNMGSMFNGCSSLTTIPAFNTYNVTNMANMFNGCSSLTTISEIDTSNVNNMYNMFNGCYSLRALPLLDVSNITNMRYFIGNVQLKNLTDIGGFKDLKISVTSGFLDKAPNLTVESLMNVINNVYDLTANGLSGQSLKFGQTNLDKLTPEQIAVATAKGWTLTA